MLTWLLLGLAVLVVFCGKILRDATIDDKKGKASGKYRKS